MSHTDRPLLLLDNSNMMSLFNEGTYKVMNLSFDEAREIIETHGEDVIKCFANSELEVIMWSYLGMRQREYQYKRIRDMRPGQDAIVFKLYQTHSGTTPTITVDGVEAKKIQNIYAYCQYVSKIG